MIYRDFMDLTDDEIKYILNEIFHPVNIGEIQRDKKWNEFTVQMTTGGWCDGNEEEFEIEDEVTLNEKGIEVDFSLDKEDTLKYKQFLMAKGCNYLLKDNPYLEI